MFTPAANQSPFDVNMAVDAGWQHCYFYTGLGLEQVPALTQDAIFSRGPKGVSRTGLFIGGRDAHLAMDMLRAAREAMVPPFQVSAFADPSGAFTTAAGMVACVERRLRDDHGRSLEGCEAVVFGGTGPVGSVCALLAAGAGARVRVVSHQSKAVAEAAAEACAQRYDVALRGADGSSDATIKELLGPAEVVFSAAKAGVQVLDGSHLATADRLLVACDVNAVPPAGIAGVGVMDDGAALQAGSGRASGIGALAVGNVKYKAQQALLKQMIEADRPVYLDFNDALRVAREGGK